MIEKKIDNQKFDEEEFVRTFLMFRSFPAEKRALAIAFIQGMNFQEDMYEADEIRQPRKPPKQIV